MTEPNELEEIVIRNDRSLRKLQRSITISQGHFSLILVRCNYKSLEDKMAQRLKELCTLEIQELYLPASIKTLFTTINTELGEQQPQVLMVFGLESVASVDQVLKSTNQVREEFRKHFQFPIVLWINDDILKKLIKLAPDFKSWAATSIKFEFSTVELINALKQVSDAAVTAILAAGAGRFYQATYLNIKGFQSDLELEFALKDLHANCQKMDSRSEANLHFLLGLKADNKVDKSNARKFYEQSLYIWQEQVEKSTKTSDDWLHYSSLLFYLGVWWRQYATQNRAEYNSACYRAKEYYQKCLEVFQQIDRSDLIAKFINGLGEVLVRLEQWDELEPVAQRAVDLHHTYSEPVRLAYSYGLCAEVALRQSNWKKAKSWAELALHANDVPDHSEFNSDWNRHHYRSLYLLLLAQAQKQLSQASDAIINLETARNTGDPQYDPLLYIRILETLQSHYFEQAQYLKAFEIKQEQKSIEQQYGLRAFAGAGRLEARRQVNNPGLAPIEQHITVAEEVASSGRMQDVNRLLERITRADCKLIIIYGQSGVGKSSILQAGLIPTLTQETFDAREALPILLQTYSDWEKKLKSCLVGNQEIAANSCLTSLSYGIEDISEKLRKNADLNLLTVLIFDQFEEFFLTHKDKNERYKFYEFLSQCLNTPFLKVILSLREDYLHFLLDFNRSYCLDVIDNNILDKSILYYLGNFSLDDAKSVIQSITKQSQFYLEPELIDELVRDLAEDDGKIRPIELQVVGAQLQAGNIMTLAQYKKRGPKRRLVERFLEEVIKDCGPNNKNIARLVLFLLTDEDGSRPLRTKAELAVGITDSINIKKLDLVLEIFVNSGLVFVLPEVSTERYQLVHDYLVTFIRQEQGTELTRKLKESEEKRRLSEAELKQVRKTKLRLIIALVCIAIVTLIASKIAIWARTNELNSLVVSSENSFSANKDFDALYSSLKAAKLLREGILNDVSKEEVLVALQQPIYRIKERSHLKGHNDWINDLSFSPDEKTLVSAGSDGVIKFWKLDSKNLGSTTSVTKNNERVNRIVFSPNGKLIAIPSNDKTVQLWTANGNLIGSFKGHTDWVGDVAFSPSDDKKIASVSSDGTIRIWTVGTRISTTCAGEDNSLRGENKALGWLGVVRFSPNGKMIAAAGKDGKLKLCTLDGKMYESKESHGNSVTDLAFSPDGKKIASASSDQTIKLWTSSGKFITTLEGHKGQVNRIWFRSDSKLLVSASQDKTVKLWSQDGKLLRSLEGHDQQVNDVKFSPDGTTIASASDDKTIKIWGLNGKLIKTLEGHNDGVTLIRFSRNGKTLASASSDLTIKLWDLDTPKDIRFLSKLSGNISKVIFSRNGKMAVLVSDDPKIWLYDSKGDLSRILTGHYDSISDADFHSNESQIITASVDGNLRVLDVSGQRYPILWRGTEKTIGSYTTSGMYVDAVEDSSSLVDATSLVVTGLDANSPAKEAGVRVGDRLLKINDEAVEGMSREDAYRLLDTKPGKVVTLSLLRQSSEISLSVEQKKVTWYASMTAIASSPSGEFVAAGSEDGSITLWSFGGKRRAEIQANGSITSLSFSPDGKMLVAANSDQTVTLWNIDNRSRLIQKWQQRHDKAVLTVSFSPDGKTIASAGEDKTIKLWSLDGTLRRTLPEKDEGKRHSGRIYSLAFSPDGKVLASASEDKTVKLWELNGNLLKTFYGHTSPVVAVHIETDNQTITSVSSDGLMIRWRPADLELNNLFRRGCNWMQTYLNSHPDSVDDKHLCEGIGIQKQP